MKISVKIILGIVIGTAAAIVLAAVGLRAYREAALHRYAYVPNDVAVTIPEGTNVADIQDILEKAGVIVGTILTPANLQREGMFFPDTYRFDRDSTPEDIVARLEATFTTRTQKYAPIAARTLIIASMLEKEVQTSEDMQLVAGIINKRMEAGIPLQLDATVAYGACVPQWKLGKPCDVTKVNIVDNIPKDSAYNTYSRKGLPIGPITNPGVRAIDAALHPKASEYWYYLSTKDGTTIFSRTLQEHNAAKRRYL